MAETSIGFEQEVKPEPPVGSSAPPTRLVKTPSQSIGRPQVRGKFLFVGEEKFWIKGVSYGAFQPGPEGREYTDQDKLNRDFAQMASLGINTVRIPHTMPPRYLLDIAQRHGLRVIVGLSAERYVGYLIDKGKKSVRDIKREILEKVRTCARHPALLCYALGNEIQAPLVRWLGCKRVERYLKGLYKVVKDEDPEGLVTYVNYPTTEYLDLSFLDLLAFNVYLEEQDRLRAYLARLQNIAGERPLLMTEIGLDSMRNGEEAQAESLNWQIRTAFEAGCVGTIIFSWTDEWHRAGAEIEDWAFGITDKSRNPKAAAFIVEQAYSEVPFPPSNDWPRISVVVCSLNGARTIRDTLEACTKLDYPDYEVIVVSDGSTDGTPNIAREYDVRLFCTENQGLSAARNLGLSEATGEIVAYIDDDAYPDPDWLSYLGNTFNNSDHVGVGGPNLLPPKDGDIATCVYNAPGGPVHVLLDDETAEHIPGCNMAFKKEALEAIGSFDPRFRAAGDDVDICWRLQDKGWTIGYSPNALVWHHRRNSIRAYWKQQRCYGKAEALLEGKWPERYNVLGHASWSGQIYGAGLTRPLGLTQRIYHGVWGMAPFQSLYTPVPNLLSSFLLMPEWFVLVILLAASTALGFGWAPMFYAAPLLVAALALPTAQAFWNAGRAPFMHEPGSGSRKLRLWAAAALLHLIQPAARLTGRLRHGLSPWRQRGAHRLVSPWPHAFAVWTEKGQPPETHLHFIEEVLQRDGARLFHGGQYDRWDLEVSGGLLGGARLLMATEDHGAGTQYVRVRVWPRCSVSGLAIALLFAGLAAGAAFDAAWTATAVLGTAVILVGMRMTQEGASATAALLWAVARLRKQLTSEDACEEVSKHED